VVVVVVSGVLVVVVVVSGVVVVVVVVVSGVVVVVVVVLVVVVEVGGTAGEVAAALVVGERRTMLVGRVPPRLARCLEQTQTTHFQQQQTQVGSSSRACSRIRGDTSKKLPQKYRLWRCSCSSTYQKTNRRHRPTHRHRSMKASSECGTLFTSVL